MICGMTTEDVTQQDISMKGPNRRFKVSPNLNPFRPKKKKKRGSKKKKPTNTKYRDYRGIDGALKDAE
jgi:hypothetical protein